MWDHQPNCHIDGTTTDREPIRAEFSLGEARKLSEWKSLTGIRHVIWSH